MFRYNLLVLTLDVVTFLWTLFFCTFFIHSVADLLKLNVAFLLFSVLLNRLLNSVALLLLEHHDTAPQDTLNTTWIYVLAHLHGNIVHHDLTFIDSLWHSFSYLEVYLCSYYG